MKNRRQSTRTLSPRWSAPAEVPGTSDGAGEPLVCLASTYTFHAAFFETELLPRFLGLQFDETEADRAFVLEREQRLGGCRVAVFVDAQHVDGQQTTLRWDQIPVRVPMGCQHSKVVLLAWERAIRLIVSSANLTRSGYRLNHEVAGAIDFFNHPESAPRRILLDALDFLGTLVRSDWITLAPVVASRLRQSLADVRRQVTRWNRVPRDFRPKERPAVRFAPGFPRQSGKSAVSPLGVLERVWGRRRASEVYVMTPFASDAPKGNEKLVARLMKLAGSRKPTAGVIVPGRALGDTRRTVEVGLPRAFRDSWRSVDDKLSVFVVPPRGMSPEGSPHRQLHGKAVAIADSSRAALLCGSSNFSPSGMCIASANIEANLCYLADYDSTVWEAFPVDWDRPSAGPLAWLEKSPLTEDEEDAGTPALPRYFLNATYTRAPSGTAIIMIAVDASHPAPDAWEIRILGEHGPKWVIADSRSQLSADSGIKANIPEGWDDRAITCLAVAWTDAGGSRCEGRLPVQVECSEQLPRPAEFLALTATAIIDGLISGRNPADWSSKRGNRKRAGDVGADIDSLTAVKTEGYVLYRVRRLGRALSVLGERVQSAAHSGQAIRYRLLDDPFGPAALAQALVAEAKAASAQEADGVGRSALLFGLCEIELVVANAWTRIGAKRNRAAGDLGPLFHEALQRLQNLQDSVESGTPQDVQKYKSAVRGESKRLLTAKSVRGPAYAG